MLPLLLLLLMAEAVAAGVLAVGVDTGGGDFYGPLLLRNIHIYSIYIYNI